MEAIKPKKKYFASDFHLGSPDLENSHQREKIIIEWLNSIESDMEELHLVGDVFDFWFEYNHVVPKGYVRLLGKLAEIADKGIPIHIYTGNHDMWMFGYLSEELNAIIHTQDQIYTWGTKKVWVGHGDGKGPGDYFYKFLKAFFASTVCQWLFARLHPNFSFWIATSWSQHSRMANDEKEQFKGADEEWLVQFCKEKLKTQHFDYFVFGHRHLPLEIPLTHQSSYINLGDWFKHYTYASFDGEKLQLHSFKFTL